MRSANEAAADGERDRTEAAEPTDLQVVLRPESARPVLLQPVTAPVRVERFSTEPAYRAAAADASDRDLLVAVERLRVQVASLTLTLELPGVEAARRERESLLGQLDDYLLPRLRRRDAPLLAVIGGSTGAGKSTLTNSLVRRVVSRSGVLRPTTRSPVLVHHPHDSGAFLSQRILPRLTRVTSEAPEPLQPIDPNAPRITGLRLVPHDGLAPGMAIIDAPDIDSLVETNRDLAVQLLAAADLWIFVTTAARYADAMPWELLRQAADRGVAVAVVLDRVPPESVHDLRVHLATRLRDRGLGSVPVFAVPESETVDGFLPVPVVAPLQQWLSRVAGDDNARSVVADRTLKGVLSSLPARAEVLAVAAEAQTQGWAQLHGEVEAVFAELRPRLLTQLVDGSLLHGEVLTRWQDFVADGAFVRRLDGNPPTLVSRFGSWLRRDQQDDEPLDVPVTENVTVALRSALRAGADDVVNRWRRHPFGRDLLAARAAEVAVDERETRLERAVRDWRLGVTSRVTAAVDDAAAAEPPTRVDPRAAADVMFVAVIDERSERPAPVGATDATGATGAPTTSDDGETAAGSVAAARRILADLLGSDSVRSLAADARADLVYRAVVLLDTERHRLERLLEDVDGESGGGTALLAAAELVEATR